MQYTAAGSPKLGVAFPRPVSIRYAWVATAIARGSDHTSAAPREVACDPPDLAELTGRDAGVTQPAFEADDPSPARPPVTATAVTSSAPFPPATCAQPFRVATATRAIEPNYPKSLSQHGPASREVAVVYVAVDARGRVADARIFSSSGYPAMDAAALNAARHSQFSPAISYCRPVGGRYLFAAVFDPN
jgi:TonB family protein